MRKQSFLLLLLTQCVACEEPLAPIDAAAHLQDNQLLHVQSLNVKARYAHPEMCAEDVLCAMDPAVTGAVSSDFREEAGTTDMTDTGVEMYCRCVLADNLDITQLFEKIKSTCGIGAPSNWLAEGGKGKGLLMSFASKNIDQACGRVVEEKGATPPCAWEFAANRVAQRKMLGVLGYSNDLLCAWRLHGWRTPPATDEGVAQTLLRHQLEPLRETIAKQSEEFLKT